MEYIKKLIDVILNMDEYLSAIIQDYGALTYALIFLVVFVETGLVIIPFLPGDSLLFAAGSFAAAGKLRLEWLYLLMILAAVAGDTVNYHMGRTIGTKIFEKERIRFIKKEYLLRTHEFYERHGGKTIIIARFIPIIRTFAPFVAGIGKMSYLRFICYNIIGGGGWVTLFITGGYFFGNLPLVKKNFSVVILMIIFISVVPVIASLLHEKKRSLRTDKSNNLL